MKKRIIRRRVPIGRKQRPVYGLFAIEQRTFTGGDWTGMDDRDRGLSPVIEKGCSWARDILSAKNLPLDFREALNRTRKKPGTAEWHAAYVLMYGRLIHQHVANGDPHASAMSMHSFSDHWWRGWIQTSGLEALALAGIEQRNTGQRGGSGRAKVYRDRDERLRKAGEGIRQEHPAWSTSRVAGKIAKEWSSRLPDERRLGVDRIRKLLTRRE